MTEAELLAWGREEYQKRLSDDRTCQERARARAEKAGLTIEEAAQAVRLARPLLVGNVPALPQLTEEAPKSEDRTGRD